MQRTPIFRVLLCVKSNEQPMYANVLKTKKSMLSTKVWLTSLLLTFAFTGIFSVTTQAQKTLFNELEATEKLEIVITTDLENIMGNRNSDEEYDATLEVFSGRDQLSSWEIKITQRGRFRRKVCGFPPLKLDFDKDELKDRGFAKFDKFKLVTHCIDDKLVGNENVMKEYLVYELYNIISPYSYRTVLTKVTYIDSKDNRNKIERYGIIMEPTSELENRMNAEEMEGFVNPPVSETQAVIENQVSLFQYLIGNEDWSIQMMRNLKAFRSKADGKYILVPYDFDFSGIINTSYAIPNAATGLASVEERAFMGNPTSEEVFQANKNLFLDKKGELIDRINDQKKFSPVAKGYMEAYINSFYADLETLTIPLLEEDTKPANSNGIKR